MIQYKGTIPEIELKYKSGETLKCKIRSSKDCYDVLMKFYDQDTIELYESFIVLYLNSANNTIGWTKHSSGGTAQCVVDPKLIFVTALKCGASGIILSHNHPSGLTRPSQADKDITRKLKDGAIILGMHVLDHIVIADNDYYSFADQGEL